MNTNTLKLYNELESYSESKFRDFVYFHTENMPNRDEKADLVFNETKLTIFEGMNPETLTEATILVAAQNIQTDIDFDKIAARLLMTKIYKAALRKFNTTDSFDQIYQESFKNYIKLGIEDNLLDERMGTTFDLDELAKTLNPAQDDIFQFIGISTAIKRYMVKDRNQQTYETPQFMWMRIAMGLSFKEEKPTEQAKKFYKKLSNIEYIPGGSTIIGAGTTYPILSNCYLIDTEDDIDHIFHNVKNIAMISKATGGIGISVTKLRAAGSPVKSNNTFSTGPIPFIKVMDTTVKSVSRAGKKAGAVAVYMENWHINFPEFLDLKQNAGDDYRRIRTANTAVYISDEFMKRVVNNENWYMFDPAETKELTELYGQEFSKKYNEYVEKAEKGEMYMFSKVPAREQMKNILTTLQSTSHPWLTWKDTINLRALNNNTGTIHCSNLCTEICLPQDRDNIAVCNLLYVNLAKHIKESGDSPANKIDWKLLEDSLRTGMRHLDNLIDVNKSPLEETKHSDDNNRAVGLGILGFAESLEMFGYAYESEEAYELMDKVAEFMSYITIDESANMAKDRGAYPNFDGSEWSKGKVPYDTITKVEESRMNYIKKDVNTSKLDGLKSKIESVSKNTTSEESKELLEIFNQLTQLIDGQSQTSDVDTSGQIEKLALKQNRNIRLDWNSLREKVKKGMRNATTMVIAPNASTGLVAGTSPGIDPRFALIFSRSTSTGKYLDINHNLVKELKKIGIWDDVREELIQSFGDISNIDGIPEKLKEVYKTSFQISPYAFIEVASRAQKWIDQAISRNMYLETRDIDEMMNIYTEAWRRGLKTTYYLHTKPRHRAEQSNVKINKGKDLNKKGFGDITSGTVQQSFDGMSDIKGFGFAKANISQTGPNTVPITSSPIASSVSMSSLQHNGSGFGFGKTEVSNTPTKVEEKVAEVKLEPSKKVMINFDACPTDPAERAACEGCQ